MNTTNIDEEEERIYQLLNNTPVMSKEYPRLLERLYSIEKIKLEKRTHPVVESMTITLVGITIVYFLLTNSVDITKIKNKLTIK